MISDPTPWWMAGSALATIAVTKGLDWIRSWKRESTSIEAEKVLLEGLTARISGLEASLDSLEERLAEETKLRWGATEEAMLLKRRVAELEISLFTAHSQLEKRK